MYMCTLLQIRVLVFYKHNVFYLFFLCIAFIIFLGVHKFHSDIRNHIRKLFEKNIKLSVQIIVLSTMKSLIMLRFTSCVTEVDSPFRIDIAMKALININDRVQ